MLRIFIKLDSRLKQQLGLALDSKLKTLVAAAGRIRRDIRCDTWIAQFQGLNKNIFYLFKFEFC